MAAREATRPGPLAGALILAAALALAPGAAMAEENAGNIGTTEVTIEFLEVEDTDADDDGDLPQTGDGTALALGALTAGALSLGMGLGSARPWEGGAAA